MDKPRDMSVSRSGRQSNARGAGPIRNWLRGPIWVWERSGPLWAGYLFALLALGVATVICLIVSAYLAPTNVSLIYLVAVIVSAMIWGLGPSLLTSVGALVLLDALFIPPFGIFSVGEFQNLVTLGVFVLVAAVISELGSRIREEAQAVRRREHEIQALYDLFREMAFAQDPPMIVDAALQRIQELFGGEAVALLVGDSGNLEPHRSARLKDLEKRAAEWTHQHGEPSGMGTERFGDLSLLCLPCRTVQGNFGVLGLRRLAGGPGLNRQDRRLLETITDRVAVALENAVLSRQAEQARLLKASDDLRAALLSSISHDLRTPLASIYGSVTTLLDGSARLEPQSRSDLLLTIQEEAARLNRLVGNLLNMTRLESGGLLPQLELYSVEELVGSTLAHWNLDGREISLDLAADLPPVPMDFVLMEQVMLNLLDNARKFSTPGSPVELEASRDGEQVIIGVADRGSGIPEHELERVFDKFYRAEGNTAPGTGLGLAICKGIVEGHGGRIRAEPRDGGGTRILISLPIA